MATDTSVGKRLERVRVELDECAEQIDRLALDLAGMTITTETTLVGAAEVAELSGLSAANIGVMAARGKLPRPVAELKCGRIWLHADIVKWVKERAA